jgi:hypothetical protein
MPKKMIVPDIPQRFKIAFASRSRKITLGREGETKSFKSHSRVPDSEFLT